MHAAILWLLTSAGCCIYYDIKSHAAACWEEAPYGQPDQATTERRESSCRRCLNCRSCLSSPTQLRWFSCLCDRCCHTGTLSAGILFCRLTSESWWFPNNACRLEQYSISMPPVNAPDWDQLLQQSEDLAARVSHSIPMPPPAPIRDKCCAKSLIMSA